MALGQTEQEKAIDEILDTFDKNMVLVIANMEKLLTAYFMNNDVTALTSLQFDIVFNDMLTQAGYYTTVNKMIDVDYNQLLPLIKDGFALGGLAIEYTQTDVAIVNALKTLQTNQYSILGSVAGTSMRESLFGYALSNWTVQDMAAQMATEFADTDLVKYSKTYANTLIGEFQQSVIDTKAADLDGVWVYVGVLDSVTRQYCACILNKHNSYDASSKNTMAADKQRKYNCRHRFRMVSREYAEQEGYDHKTSTDCT